MSNLSHNQPSPFDSIRRVDEQDNEYWMGRELMPVLEYQQWRRFEDAIDRAKISCQIAKNIPESHFEFLPGSAKSPNGGRPGDDYRLTRYACHLIAMNGDVRKEAIAQAQAYFSLKATDSEAKIIQPQSTAEMLVLFAQQALEQERRTKALEAKLAQIEAIQTEAIASLDEIPQPEVEAEELTTRAKLNRLVKDYATANALHFQEVWRRLYREFRDRYHIDLRQRAKNIQASGGKFKALDICEQLGKIEELYAVAFDLLKS